MGNADFWAGEFGNAYLERNQVDWRARVGFWRMVISLTSPNSVLEIGANAGWNLRAIREASPGTYVCGIDINLKAALAAYQDGYMVYQQGAENLDLRGRKFDLVFTAGVLIHISPEQLNGVMWEAVDKSNRYILAIEYESDREEEVEYRGHSGKLWRRPFGELYQAMGLRLVHTGPAGQGFDRCTYWLLEKT